MRIKLPTRNHNRLPRLNIFPDRLLAERGLDISYETIRRWVLKFGPLYARNLRRRRPRPSDQWHLDEMVVTIGGRRMYLWRAVDDEGEVLDMLVQRRRNKAAAVKLLRKLMKKLGFAPCRLVTDKLPSYGAAKADIGMTAEHEKGLRKNNRAENSHQPVRRREHKQQRFKSAGSAQRFLDLVQRLSSPSVSAVPSSWRGWAIFLAVSLKSELIPLPLL